MYKKLIFILITCFSFISCSSDEEEVNKNSIFYNTEWFSNKQDNGLCEGLKFYDNDRVAYYWLNNNSSTIKDDGTFEYNPSSKEIIFHNLSFWNSSYMTIEITKAKLINEKSMRIYWHFIGDVEKSFVVWKLERK